MDDLNKIQAAWAAFTKTEDGKQLLLFTAKFHEFLATFKALDE